MRPVPRIWLMIFSFLISLSLWAYVQVQENPTKPPVTSFTLEVQIKNLPENFSLVKSPEPIKLFPIGAPEEIARIDEKDLSAVVDLSAPKIGMIEYPVKLVIKGDYAVRFEPRVPTANIEIQRKVSKLVPVRVQVSNGFTHGDYWYQPEQTYTEPATIRISGPAPDVDSVVEARATLDLSKVSPGQTFSSGIELLENGNRSAPRTVEADPKTVVVYPSIAVGLDTRTVYVQPVYKGQPPFGYVIKSMEVTPNEVQLRGRPEVLAGLTMVSSAPVDLSQLKASDTVTLSLNLPTGVILSPPQTVTLRIVIEATAPKTPAVPPGSKPTRRTNK